MIVSSSCLLRLAEETLSFFIMKGCTKINEKEEKCSMYVKEDYVNAKLFICLASVWEQTRILKTVGKGYDGPVGYFIGITVLWRR